MSASVAQVVTVDPATDPLWRTLANLGAGRFAVVASRLAEHGEAGDDHQSELAEELVARGLAVHHEPEKITADALLATRSWAVRRIPEVPQFGLR